MVSKADQDKAKIAVAEEHLPLRDLGDGRALPSEDEIALANVNMRKEEEKKRKAARENKNCDKGIAKPAQKAKKK